MLTAADLLLLQQERQEYLDTKLAREKQHLQGLIDNYVEGVEFAITQSLEDYMRPHSSNVSPFVRVFRGLRWQLPPLHYDTENLEKHGLEPPFITLQKKYAKRGFYLLDESDSSKSAIIHINLWFLEPQHYGKVTLSHGYNLVPQLTDL